MRTRNLARLSSLVLGSCVSMSMMAATLLVVTARAEPQAPASAAPQQEPLRLRIGVTAVEIDAVVTGRGNRPVTDLRPEEFEILQDGRRQTVLSAQYIPLDPPAAPTDAGAAPGTPAGSPPARTPRRDEVRHTMAIIVDDLNLSFISTARVRDALRIFINRNLHAGDLVTIVPTGRGVGSVQPFTTDKRMLLETASRLRFNVSQLAWLDDSDELRGGDGERFDAVSGLDSTRQDVRTASALSAVSAVIRGMRDMPGRKSVLLVSDGWSQLRFPRGSGPLTGERLLTSGLPEVQPRITEAMRRLVDEANRSFVVIYTLDARGLVGPNLHLDRAGGPSPGDSTAESIALFESQGGPQVLASLGGGLFFRNNNNLSGMMARAMEDQRGYYLIGFQPDEATFEKEKDRAKFHVVKVRVSRPGVKVRARTGYFGVTDEELAAAPPRTREARMLRALNQPFASSDVGLETTSLFWRHPTRGPMVRALLYVDTETLSFQPRSDGGVSAPLELAAALIDERGVVASHHILSLTVSARRAAERPEEGFVYAVDLPVTEAGPYQLRTVVRDVEADRLGSASELVIVPDTRGERLALSGVMLSGARLSDMVATNTESLSSAPPTSVEESATPPTIFNPTRPDAADPARRHFVAGMAVDYTFQVYNAERDRATGRPVLTSAFRLFRDGTLVEDGTLAPQTTDAAGDTLAKRKTALSMGRLRLSDNLQPGAYDLEVAVTDTLGRKNHPAVQWTNFTLSPRTESPPTVSPR